MERHWVYQPNSGAVHAQEQLANTNHTPCILVAFSIPFIFFWSENEHKSWVSGEGKVWEGLRDEKEYDKDSMKFSKNTYLKANI